MCIAILKPYDKTISESTLRQCATRNPDGCGFAYCEGGKIYIKKFMDFERFLSSYKEVENKSNMLIHFRIATHGKVEVDNCHPFKLNSRMALIHNGIISGYGDRNSLSDTRDFIDRVIGKISYKMWKNPSFRQLVKDAIGYSKLAILDISGDYYIVNEESGIWDNGIWYSNSSYKPYTPIKKAEPIKTSTEIIQKENTPSSTPAVVDEVNILYKCGTCNKEFKTSQWEELDDCKCPYCGSFYTEDIGWEENGSKFYYDSVYV